MNNKKIVICIPTFKRPIYLKNNLDSLKKQQFKSSFEIVVVDNDINKTSENIVNEFNHENIKASYYVESNRGISSVRNRCIEICKIKQADYMIFIDDDEIAEPEWLSNLFIIEKKYNAKIVIGPVLCKFESEPSSIIKNIFFNRSRNPNGTIIKNAATGNVLLNMGIFNDLDLKLFNPFFNLIGGGDTLFFNQISLNKVDIFWANDAITYEFISSERSLLKNCFKRSYYRGESAFYIFKIEHGFFKTMVKMFINFLIIFIDIFRLIFFIILMNKYKIMKILKKIVRGIGFINAIFNYKYKEYNVTFGK